MNGAREISSGLLDGRKDGDHSGVRFVKISIIFVAQITFFVGTGSFKYSIESLPESLPNLVVVLSNHLLDKQNWSFQTNNNFKYAVFIFSAGLTMKLNLLKTTMRNVPPNQ